MKTFVDGWIMLEPANWNLDKMKASTLKNLICGTNHHHHNIKPAKSWNFEGKNLQFKHDNHCFPFFPEYFVK